MYEVLRAQSNTQRRAPEHYLYIVSGLAIPLYHRSSIRLAETKYGLMLPRYTTSGPLFNGYTVTNQGYAFTHGRKNSVYAILSSGNGRVSARALLSKRVCACRQSSMPFIEKSP